MEERGVGKMRRVGIVGRVGTVERMGTVGKVGRMGTVGRVREWGEWGGWRVGTGELSHLKGQLEQSRRQISEVARRYPLLVAIVWKENIHLERKIRSNSSTQSLNLNNPIHTVYIYTVPVIPAGPLPELYTTAPQPRPRRERHRADPPPPPPL